MPVGALQLEHQSSDVVQQLHADLVLVHFLRGLLEEQCRLARAVRPFAARGIGDRDQRLPVVLRAIVQQRPA